MTLMKRTTLILFVTLLWGSFFWQVSQVEKAASNTPFINNIRRALNECVVRGRLTNEFDGNVQFINMNSRIVCNMQGGRVAPRR
ncbi:MAG: hypothetical protein ACKO43_00635 [Alphaproteobacteria bacterium]